MTKMYKATKLVVEDLPTDFSEEMDLDFAFERMLSRESNISRSSSSQIVNEFSVENISIDDHLGLDDIFTEEQSFWEEDVRKESTLFEERKNNFLSTPSLQDSLYTPSSRITLPKEWLIGLTVLIASAAIIFFAPSNELEEMMEIEDVEQGWVANGVSSHKGNEIEMVANPLIEQIEAPEKTQQSKAKKTPPAIKPSSKPKKEKSRLVEVDGMALLSISGPTKIGMQVADLGTMSTNDLITRDITKLRKNLSYCHTKHLKKNPTARGKWDISFTVQATGDVTSTQVTPLRKANGEIEECMIRRINKFEFSKPDSAYPVQFSILFG